MVFSTRASKKAMIILFFTGIRLLKLVRLPQGQQCNKERFVNETLAKSNEECNHGAGSRITKTVKIHMDNSRVPNALETAEKIPKRTEGLARPPYSFDLGPCNFWLLDGPRHGCEIGALLV
jgi:hypothetical protein